MRSLDFLSESPKSLIFNQGSNKTFFGGALSLIYLIIVLIIAIFYLINYLMSDKYSVEYGFYQDILDINKEKEMMQSDDYNPNMQFSHVITDPSGNLVSDRFIVINITNNQTIPETFNSRLSELPIGILYRCDSETKCDLTNNDPKEFNFYLAFHGYKLSHQGEIPLFKQDSYYVYRTEFYFNNPLIKVYSWKIIKYIENLGFSEMFYDMFGIDKNNEYIGGTIKGIENFNLKDIYEEEVISPFPINNTYYKFMGLATMNLDLNSYDEYKRTKISILDVIADICSLSMTIFTGFIFCFSNYYSNSFDNYEIMDKILSKDKINIRNKINNDDFNKDNAIIRESNESQGLIQSSDNDNIIEDKTEEKFIENKEEEQNRALPKLNFIDYIINHFYCEKCCKENKKQSLISSCNDIISKYYTVEDIIYNQIKLENLFKDYKWNDPSLNSIDSNEYITQIKKIFSNY